MQGVIIWTKTGKTHYYAQLGILYKGRAIKGLQWFGSGAFGPAKWLVLGCYEPYYSFIYFFSFSLLKSPQCLHVDFQTASLQFWT